MPPNSTPDRFRKCINEVHEAVTASNYDGLLQIIADKQLLRDDWSGESVRHVFDDAVGIGDPKIVRLLVSLPPMRRSVACGAHSAFREAIRCGRTSILEILFEFTASHQVPSTSGSMALIFRAFYNAPFDPPNGAEKVAEAFIYTLENHHYFRQHKEDTLLKVYGNTQRLIAPEPGDSPGDPFGRISRYRRFCNILREKYKTIFDKYPPQLAQGQMLYDFRSDEWSKNGKVVGSPKPEATPAAASTERASP